MGYFTSPEEVDKYIGEMFRQAADHPVVGPKLRAANVTMRVVYEDPACEMTVRFTDPMGGYNLAIGLARSEVKAKGPVPKILKLVPLTKPLFPVYRDLVAQKDGQP